MTLAGKVGLVLRAGKRKCGVERAKMEPLPTLPAGVKGRQKGIGREQLAGSTC